MPFRDAVISVKEAEKRGFESTWIVESTLNPGKDAVSYLGALAVSTERIQLATGVITPFSRSITLIASTMATLDEISNGRIILGIGTGHIQTSSYHSIDFRDPLIRIREYVEVFQQLINGSSVNHEGRCLRIQNLKLNVHPIRQRIPVYLATVSEQLARIAGEIADGVIFIMTSPLRVGQLVNAVAAGAESAGRSISEVDVACYLPCFMMEDRETSLRAARHTVAGYGRSVFYRRLYRKMGYRKEADLVKDAWEKGDVENAISQVPEPMARDLTVVGSPEECVRRIEEYRRIGVKLPIIQAFYGQGDLESNVMMCLRTFGT
jgi:alkanesulfonate monooxygenase SsuD/methylene tetrahydromethanopterin reductase-like flavin-dependent oxidoreductase (luciferase family)